MTFGSGLSRRYNLVCVGVCGCSLCRVPGGMMTTLTVGHAHGGRSARSSSATCVRARGGRVGRVGASNGSSNKYGVRDAVRYGTADLRADAAFGRLAAAGRTVHVGVGCARWARASGSGHSALGRQARPRARHGLRAVVQVSASRNKPAAWHRTTRCATRANTRMRPTLYQSSSDHGVSATAAPQQLIGPKARCTRDPIRPRSSHRTQALGIGTTAAKSARQHVERSPSRCRSAPH